MAKKKSNEIDAKGADNNGKTNRQAKQKTNLSENLPQKKLRSTKLSTIEMKNNNVKLKKKDQSYHSEDQQQKNDYELPTKIKKRISKKKKGKSSKNNQKTNKSGIKLQRGYKLCQNCQTVLNIHKYVCTQCGFVHNMKKHKFDVMKNLSKATPKIVKSIIESNEFNTINLSDRQTFAYASSFDLKKLLVGKEEAQIDTRQKNQNNIKNEEIKRRKSHVTNNVQSQIINEKEAVNTNKINFEELRITKPFEFSSTFQAQKLKLKFNHNQFNKTREQFSIYKSPYPIICMEGMNMPANEKTKDDMNPHQTLIFTQCVSKKQYFSFEKHAGDVLGINGHQGNVLNHEEIGDMMNEEDMDKGTLLKKQKLRQQKLKEEEEKANQLKLQQNNTITQKALGLGNYHKISAFYRGETIINVMPVERRNSTNSKQGLSIEQHSVLEQSFKRRSSSRSARSGKQKFPMELMEKEENKKVFEQITDKAIDDHTAYDVIRIGLKEHVQMLKTVLNKVAILTGKKSILLMNLEPDWSNTLKGNKNINLQSNGKTQSKKDAVMFWLSQSDFNQNYKDQFAQNINDQYSKRYLSSISLSKEGQEHFQDDQFTVIQWLKIHKSTPHGVDNNNEESYLITGTLFGHIIIYKVTNKNLYETYRTIIGAHFQLVNCLSECPLNVNGTALFASASYDGSVKIWQLNRTQPVSQFQVSNRKIQSIHWDSGAKFLLIVRDEGLQNCYLACFYSVNNRIQLPMMLTDTIDFRLIRNGLMFDNSCSPLITFPLNSKLIVMLNSRNGFLKILETEELRKTSLKRKKSKKNYQQLLYHDYWIKLGLNLQKSQFIKQSQSLQVIEMKSNCTDFANYGFVLKDQQQIQTEHRLQEEKQENVIHVEDSEQSEPKQRSQNLQEKNQIKHANIMKHATKLPPSSQPEPIGIRKSLRARKPNIQYNFMQEEQNNSQQQSVEKNKIKKIVKNKGKKKNSSDDDFENQSQDFSQEIENAESEESFQNHKKNPQKNKPNPTKNHIGNKTKNLNKQKPKNQLQKGTQLRKSLRFQKDQKKQEESKDQQGQEKLYKMFWQQTNEESLVNKKEDYPCNRFPKFSGITSFLTVQGDIKKSLECNQRQKINEQQEKPLPKPQYLTTFISTNNGELIRVRIKIDGYSQEITETKSIDQNQQELQL